MPLLLLLAFAASVHPSQAAAPAPAPRCDASRAGQLHALKGWCGTEARRTELARRHATTVGGRPEKESCETGADPTARCPEVLASGADVVGGNAVRVGRTLVTIGGTKGLTVTGYDAVTGRRTYAYTYAVPTTPFFEQAVAAGGLVVAAGNLSLNDDEGSYGWFLVAIDPRDGSLVWQRQGPLTNHHDEAFVAGDATHLYTARWEWEQGTDYAEDWVVERLDPRTGRTLWSRSDHRHDKLDQCPLALAVHGDRVVVVGYQEPAPGGSYVMDQRVDVYTSSGRLLQRTVRDLAGDDDELYAVSTSQDGRYAGFTGFATSLPTAPTAAAGLVAGWQYKAPIGVVDLRTGRPAWWSYSDGVGAGAEAYSVAWAGPTLMLAEDTWFTPTGAFLAWPVGVRPYVGQARLRAFKGSDGAALWSTALGTSSRVGLAAATAVRDDGKVAYLLGVEGPVDAYVTAYASPVAVWQPTPINTFVRAVDTRSGSELWTGRDSGPAAAPGSISNAFALLPVGRDVVVNGRLYVASTGVGYRGAWTVGRVLRFHGD